MAVNAKDVKSLREKTGVGMMDCKKALEETNGNFDEAIKLLREKGLAVAAKKADRIAADGIVDILYDENLKVAVMAEVNSETDFVAKNEKFQEFVKGCLKVILKDKPADVAELLAKPFGDDNAVTVDEALKDQVLQIKENISIRRFVAVEGTLGIYIHNKGSIGVIVKVDAGDIADGDAKLSELIKNLTLQIASMNPVYVNKSDVPQSVIDEEREIITAQINGDEDSVKKLEKIPEDKRGAILAKMVEGKVDKYYENNCLLEQGYVKEEKITVGEYIDNYNKENGSEVKVSAFYRFEKGEGIQKREDNFAEEIAQLTGNK
ncbi:MAG: translation elongation factor Ts [Oscillospiraceae bacterium]|nr:translation elongation factor Ts [Oscillospiraceae bacterium]